MAKAIMLQGTGSGVGKSVLTAALCRIFLRDGHTVAPFKAQNMALNSFVCDDGGEIGRAQAVQAQACRIEPTVDMNPVLLKPRTDIGAQVIVRGRPVGNFTAKVYTTYKKKITAIVDKAFQDLAKRYEIIVIEGAGSPAEINLKSHDIVNMRAAFVADAPVILVGDIDKGGVFAWLVGTLKLLDRRERKRIKGFIINKFRGDIGLLKPGLRFLEKATGIKVLGVIPYFKGIEIPEEDGIYWKNENHRPTQLKVGVINIPHIANHTDFDIFKKEDADFSYINKADSVRNMDIIILPGTKNTPSDMRFLRRSGFEEEIKRQVKKGKFLVGVCGGFQMLGKILLDPSGIESDIKEIAGFGLFDFRTIYEAKKITKQVSAKPICAPEAGAVKGYEIHHGQTVWDKAPRPIFMIKKRGKEDVEIPDGACAKDFQVWGTHIHGIFDNYNLRKWFLNLARERLGLPKKRTAGNLCIDKELDKLANLVRKNIDLKGVYKILNHL